MTLGISDETFRAGMGSQRQESAWDSLTSEQLTKSLSLRLLKGAGLNDPSLSDELGGFETSEILNNLTQRIPKLTPDELQATSETVMKAVSAVASVDKPIEGPVVKGLCNLFEAIGEATSEESK